MKATLVDVAGIPLPTILFNLLGQVNQHIPRSYPFCSSHDHCIFEGRKYAAAQSGFVCFVATQPLGKSCSPERPQLGYISSRTSVSPSNARLLFMEMGVITGHGAHGDNGDAGDGVRHRLEVFHVGFNEYLRIVVWNTVIAIVIIFNIAPKLVFVVLLIS